MKKHTNVFETVMFSLIAVAMLAVVGFGSYCLINQLVNKTPTSNEAVVINGDTDFNKSIEYTAELAPGGHCEQYIEVKSLIIQKVEYNFTFTSPEAGKDFSSLSVDIKIGDILAESNKCLKEIFDEKKVYTSTLVNNATEVVTIVYKLPFEYQDQRTSWNFKIDFSAKGKAA